MFALLILAAENVAFGQLSTVENKFPENVPLKVEFRNYESTNWINDMEIVLTNTGDKPIYFLYFFLMFDRGAAGKTIGFPFMYGDRKKLLSPEGKPQMNGVPIGPGESYAFKVRPDIIEGWEKAKAERGIKGPMSAYLDFNLLDFADGTFIQRENRPDKKP
jgi:hypothetical protein